MSLTTHPLHVAHPVHIVILVVLTTAFLGRDLRNKNLWLEIDMGGSLIMPFCEEHYKNNASVFLAVQDSSISDLVTHSLTPF